jgi:hypothetical protein
MQISRNYLIQNEKELQKSYYKCNAIRIEKSNNKFTSFLTCNAKWNLYLKSIYFIVISNTYFILPEVMKYFFAELASKQSSIKLMHVVYRCYSEHKFLTKTKSTSGLKLYSYSKNYMSKAILERCLKSIFLGVRELIQFFAHFYLLIKSEFLWLISLIS